VYIIEGKKYRVAVNFFVNLTEIVFFSSFCAKRKAKQFFLGAPFFRIFLGLEDPT